MVCQPAAVWFPISSPRRVHTRAQLASTYRASCHGKQVQEDPGGRGPVRAPAAVSLHDRRGQPLDQVGGVVVRRGRRDDVQAVSTTTCSASFVRKASTVRVSFALAGSAPNLPVDLPQPLRRPCAARTSPRATPGRSRPEDLAHRDGGHRRRCGADRRQMRTCVSPEPGGIEFRCHLPGGTRLAPRAGTAVPGGRERHDSAPRQRESPERPVEPQSGPRRPPKGPITHELDETRSQDIP